MSDARVLREDLLRVFGTRSIVGRESEYITCAQATRGVSSADLTIFTPSPPFLASPLGHRALFWVAEERKSSLYP